MPEAPRVHATYQKAIGQLEESLPPDLLDAWKREGARKLYTLEETKIMETKRYLKPPLPFGKQAPASKLMVISGVVQYRNYGAMLDDPCGNLGELVERHRIVELLNGPMRDLGGPSKILVLRAAKTFHERILRRPTTKALDLAMLHIRANELAKDYSGALKEYAAYREAALSLEPTMGPGEPHDVTSAIMAREKAIACIGVSVDPRLGEGSGLLLDDIHIDGTNATVDIWAEISKERVCQSRALDPECALPVIEYVKRARPFLSGMRPSTAAESNALWLTRTGSPLCQEGVSQALSIVLSAAMGVPVGAKILRKVVASREDLADHEIAAALGQALHSLLGIDLYGLRDQLKAQRALVACWDRIDSAIASTPLA